MDILYRDEHVVAVDKPAGLLVHRSALDARESRCAVQLVRDAVGARVYPVHRLDKPTSGVLLFSLTPDSARRMGELFATGGVCKTYLAVVRGHAPEGGLIDYPLREELDSTTDSAARQRKLAQPAVTAYRRLAIAELPVAVGRYATARYSLMGLTPRTGRKHQIRRHMKHIFHPIIGDTTYGDGRHNRFFREWIGTRRLLLCAAGLTFEHPYTGEPLLSRHTSTPNCAESWRRSASMRQADGRNAAGPARTGCVRQRLVLRLGWSPERAVEPR